MRGRLPLGVLFGVALVLAVGAAGVVWARSGSAPAGETARFVPAGALVYAVVNTDAASRQWAQMSQILDRLGVAGDLRRARDEAVSDEDLDWERDIAPYLGGEAAFAVLSADDEPSMLLLLSAADGEKAWKHAVEALDRRAREEGERIQTRTYRGVEIRIYGDAGDSLSLARKDRYLIGATSPDVVQQALDLEAGRGASLAENSRFKSARAAVSADPLLFVYGNLGGALDGAESLFGELLPPGALDSADMVTDLDRLALAVAISAEPGGLKLETQVLGLINKRGDLSMPRVGNESRFARRAPAGSLVFVWGRDLWTGTDASLKDILSGLRNDPDAGDTAEMLDEALAEARRELGFDVDADLLSQLKGEFALALGAGDLSSDDLWVLAMSTVKDAATVSRSLAKIAQYERNQGRLVEQVKVGGQDIWESREGPRKDVEYAYGITGDELLVGYGPDAVRRGIERKDNLEDTADFKDAQRHLPDGRMLAAYINLKRITELPDGDLDLGLSPQAMARLRYIVLGFTQKADRAGFTAYLRVAEN